MWPWLYKWLPIRSAIPTGELTEANVQLNLGNFEEAVDLFTLANDEFKARSRQEQNWYAADDGLAVAYLRMKKFDAAREAADRSAAEKEGGYDSAEYHRAEIDENQLFDKYYDKDDMIFCDSEKLFESTMGKYDELLKRYPTFSVAYTQQGEMLLRRSNWIRQRTQTQGACTGLAQEWASPSDIAKILDVTKRALETATIEDSENPMSWFQYANALYESQEPRLKNSLTDKNERLTRLGEAIVNYKKTLEFIPNDAYVHLRIGQALSDYGELRSENTKGALLQEAGKELCEAITWSSRSP
jgi:tetratricopeptide (TPR) repeat protein